MATHRSAPSYTVESLIDAVHRRFIEADLYYGHGTDNAWDEAVALVLSQTGLPDDETVLNETIQPAVVADIVDMAELRATRRLPLAYVIGSCQYRGVEFLVKPGVIVPRSPIGFLLQDGLAPWLRGPVSTVLDLCCGSGCLGILAALDFPQSRVVMVDVDPRAVALARQNVVRHGLSERIDVVQRDVLDQGLEPGRQSEQSFDLILCNPPYVNREDMAALPREYLAEPVRGLAAGDDGLDVMAPLMEILPTLLSEQGLFVGEVGNSAAALRARFPEHPFIWPELPYGGEGVFLLEAEMLSSHTARLG